MTSRKIIVIGASAGGLEPIKEIVRDLPADLQASVSIVWHMAPGLQSFIPQVLNKSKTVPVVTASDGERIAPNKIYVAKPDHHLLIDGDRVVVSKGPKENRFRPAVDPLFRSAAQFYGRQVIGIILSGALDDGTAGLWKIKEAGGITIVQDPEEAEVKGMPEAALQQVKIDYVLPVARIAAVLTELCNEVLPEPVRGKAEMNDLNETEIAMGNNEESRKVIEKGELTPFTCPECHGVLTALNNGGIVRYRCHTGHAFSSNILLTSISENIENTLWQAMRAIQESIMLLNRVGDDFAAHNQPKVAAAYFQKAKEEDKRLLLLRALINQQEILTNDDIAGSFDPEV